MFDILLFLFESYFDIGSYPDHDKLSVKLSAAGFEEDDINQALTWLSGLQQLTRAEYPESINNSGIRLYTDFEEQRISPEGLRFLAFWEHNKVITPIEREMIIDRVIALVQPVAASRRRSSGISSSASVMLSSGTSHDDDHRKAEARRWIIRMGARDSSATRGDPQPGCGAPRAGPAAPRPGPVRLAGGAPPLVRSGAWRIRPPRCAGGMHAAAPSPSSPNRLGVHSRSRRTARGGSGARGTDGAAAGPRGLRAGGLRRERRIPARDRRARSGRLPSQLAMPTFLVDEKGVLVFYNEGAEEILGRRFEEAGAMTPREWLAAFTPRDVGGQPLPAEALPLTIALREQRPAHADFRIRGLDGVDRCIEATAFPLIGLAGRRAGAVVVFWKRPDT